MIYSEKYLILQKTEVSRNYSYLTEKQENNKNIYYIKKQENGNEYLQRNT